MIKRLLILILFFSSVLFNFVKAQKRSLVWHSKFEDKMGWSHSTGIVQGVNDNIFSVGYGSFPYTSTSSYSQNAVLVCQDRLGNEKWTKIFGGEGTDRFLAIENTIDGNIIAAGTTSSSDGSLSGTGSKSSLDAWVIKLDTLGNVLWQKTYDILGREDIINSISKTDDGGYVFCGNTKTSEIRSDIFLFKIDAIGNEIWRKVIHGNINDEANQIIAKNESIYLVGNTDSDFGEVTRSYGYKDDVVVFKFNDLGTIIWQKIVGGFYEDLGVSLAISGDGGIVVACQTRSCDGDIVSNNGCASAFYFPKFFLFKLNDLNGSFLWKRDVYNDYSSLAKFVKTSTDGNIIACGVREQSFFLSKINQVNGEDLWIENAGSTNLPNHSSFKTSFALDNEGGYLVASSGGAYLNGRYHTAKICPKVIVPHNLNWIHCKGDSMNIVKHYIGEPITDNIKLYFNIKDSSSYIDLDTLDLSDQKKIKLPHLVKLGNDYLIDFSINKSNFAAWSYSSVYFGPTISITGNILSGKGDPSPKVNLFAIGKPPFHIKLNEHSSFTFNQSFVEIQPEVMVEVGSNTFVVEELTDQCGYEGLKKGVAKVEKTDYCTSLSPNVNFFTDSSGYINDFILKDKNGIVYENRNSKYSDFTYFQSKDTIQLKKNREYEINLEMNKTRGDVLAWIDYNHDNVFSNSELIFNTIFSGNLNGVNKSTFNFTINQNRLSGTTRLRLRFANLDNQGFVSCGLYGENEIEDYYVNIEDNFESSIFLNNQSYFLCKGKTLSIGQTNYSGFSSQNVFKAIIRKKSESNFSEIAFSTSLPFQFELPPNLELDEEYVFKIISTDPVIESIDKIFVINSVPGVDLSGFDIITKDEGAFVKFNFEGIPPFKYGFSYNSQNIYKTDLNFSSVLVEPKVNTEYFPTFVSNACGFGLSSGSAIVEVRDSLPVQFVDCFNLNQNLKNQIGTDSIENFGSTYIESLSPGNFGLELKSAENDYFQIKKDQYQLGAFSTSFWFKFYDPISYSSDMYFPILSSKVDTWTKYCLGIGLEYLGSRLVLKMKTQGEEKQVLFDKTIEWHNVIIIQSKGLVEIYFNNILVFSNYTSVNLSIPDTWTFGRNENYYFDGIIDELKYFSGKISQNTRNELYNNSNLCSLSSLECVDYGFAKSTIKENSQIKAMKSIEAINVIETSGNVLFEAGENVILRPGFNVKKGGLFKADIKNCLNQ